MAEPTEDRYTEYLEFALELAEGAEESILPRYRSCAVMRKADGSEVTAADREAEQAMVRMIRERYPDHGIVGEEYGESAQSVAGCRWVLDPIDGTASFTLGVPLFGTLIGLLEGQEAVAGVIHFPALGETVYAAAGRGCWWRSGGARASRVHVAPPVLLAEAAVSATGPHSSDIECKPGETPYRLSRVIQRAGKFRFVPDCYQHALVCRGSLHAAIDPVMNLWDIAALLPCIREAGGVAEPLRGGRNNVLGGGSLITASSQALLAEVAATLCEELP